MTAVPALHCVVVTGDVYDVNAFDTEDDLIAHLRSLYAKARRGGDLNTRVMVFQGTRLGLVGTEDRALVTADGRRLVIVDRAPQATDHLLSTADRASPLSPLFGTDEDEDS